MKSKKSTKGTPNKQQDKKNDSTSLLSLLVAKHSQSSLKKDKASQSAQLLESVLTGSDEQLTKILQNWNDQEAIPSIIKAWGSGHSIMFFQRLTLLLDNECRWAFPWISQLLRLRIEFNASDLQIIQAYSENRHSSSLQQVLQFEGKLRMFES